MLGNHQRNNRRDRERSNLDKPFHWPFNRSPDRPLKRRLCVPSNPWFLDRRAQSRFEIRAQSAPKTSPSSDNNFSSKILFKRAWDLETHRTEVGRAFHSPSFSNSGPCIEAGGPESFACGVEPGSGGSGFKRLFRPHAHGRGRFCKT